MLSLTPIYVRGRRKKRLAASHSPDNGVSQSKTKSKGGRPLMTPDAHLLSTQTKTNVRARRLIAPPKRSRKKRLSRLENLPVELIERIFLYALNVNLPRASPSLAAAISSESVYRALILLALWDDPPAEGDGQSSPEPQAQRNTTEIARILRPLDYAVPLSDAERRTLQIELFRCRWCTIPRVLAQLPDLLSLVVQCRWFDAGMQMSMAQARELKKAIAKDSDARVFDGSYTTTLPSADNARNADTYTRAYTLTLNPPLSITITNTTTGAPTTHPLLSLLSIPDSLLTPTHFTPTHTLFLDALRFTSNLAQPTLLHPPNLTLSRPALQSGIRTAILEPNLSALSTLLKLDEYYVRATTPPPNPSPDDPSSAPLPPLYSIPEEHFRLATSSPPPDLRLPLFQLLLRCSAESVPADDAQITAWAMDEAGAEFGAWVLDWIMRVPGMRERARRDARTGSLFYLGRLNVGGEGDEMARRYRDLVLGGEREEREEEELGCWMGEAVGELGALWDGNINRE